MPNQDYFRNKFLNLKRAAEQKGYTVRLVPSKKLGDFAGMNPEAAERMGYPEPKDTFDIDAGMSWELKFRTLVHELREYGKMKKGASYWKAHKYASDNEFTVGGLP